MQTARILDVFPKPPVVDAAVHDKHRSGDLGDVHTPSEATMHATSGRLGVTRPRALQFRALLALSHLRERLCEREKLPTNNSTECGV